MSNFICEKCGATCQDSELGYITGCEHYPVDAHSLDKCAMGKEHVWVDIGERWVYWTSNNTSVGNEPKSILMRVKCKVCGAVKYQPGNSNREEK